jgi:hypothetical protein
MTYFAKCDQTANSSARIVTDVISAEQEFVDTQPGFWVQTSYNTYGNVHYAPSPPAAPRTPDGLPPLRGNYAGIGYTYDIPNDVFYAPQPYPSWILNESTWLWEAPVPYPTDGGNYYWDEATLSWVLIPPPVTP